MSHYILADCNNFYASCERLLNPNLEGKPVVILSNNDGCVISRSQEAKDLGIKMGDPFFKIKDFCKRSKVFVFSSNYRLYGDISARIMTIYAETAPELEIYSIDEAFLKYPSSLSSQDVIEAANHLRAIIKRWVGIPISIGIGPTKTLAKVANNMAKKKKLPVLDLSCAKARSIIFQQYPIGEVWGIGRQLEARLKSLNIHTVADYINSEILFIRKKMGVVGERMYYELQGKSCLELTEVASKKSITCSRSFGKVLSEETEVAEALSFFAARASLKLREQKSYVKSLFVFLERTATTEQGFQRFHSNASVLFPIPTQDTSEIITAAKQCLKRIFRNNLGYKKCGIIFTDLISEDEIIPDLFSNPDPKRKAVMKVIDELNKKYGKNTLFFGAMGTNPQWKMRADCLSLHNTTSWRLLPIAKS
jgi:DNA polymerase V